MNISKDNPYIIPAFARGWSLIRSCFDPGIPVVIIKICQNKEYKINGCQKTQCL